MEGPVRPSLGSRALPEMPRGFLYVFDEYELARPLAIFLGGTVNRQDIIIEIPRFMLITSKHINPDLKDEGWKEGDHFPIDEADYVRIACFDFF